MRPSSISFSSVIRAISRRIPSNEERTTAFGVSSMMKSTPVRCSSVRMFRPSRPMIRPFMSSDGSSTSVTVVSAAALAATRCSASATRFRARRFASPAASSSSCRTRPASSCRTCSSESWRIRAFASPVVIDEMRSSSWRWASLSAFSSSWSCFRCCSRSAIPWSRRVSSVSFREMSSSCASTRSSILTTASRRSRTSVSSSARSLIACSRASMPASRRVASASRRASSISAARSRRAARQARARLEAKQEQRQ